MREGKYVRGLTALLVGSAVGLGALAGGASLVVSAIVSSGVSYGFMRWARPQEGAR